LEKLLMNNLENSYEKQNYEVINCPAAPFLILELEQQAS